MSRLTISEVQDAVTSLKMKGEKISALNVRKHLGHGSYSSVIRFLNTLKQHNEQDSREDKPILQDTAQATNTPKLEPNANTIAHTDSLNSQNNTSESSLHSLNTFRENANNCSTNESLISENNITEHLDLSNSTGQNINSFIHISARAELIKERQKEIARLRKMANEASIELELSLKRQLTIKSEGLMQYRLIQSVITNGYAPEIPGDLKRALLPLLSTQSKRPQSELTMLKIKKLAELLKILTSH